MNENNSSNLLKTIFNAKKKKNPRFSLRAFARQLNMSSGRLSEILNGRRTMTLKMASHIVSNLNEDDIQPEEFLKIVSSERQKVRLGIKLKDDAEKLLLNPKSQALLSYLAIPGINQDPVAMGQALGISVTQCEQFINELINLELVRRDFKGRLLVTHSKTAVFSQVHSDVIRQGHIERLKYISKAIEEGDTEERDLGAMMFCMDPKDFNHIKDLILKFRKSIADNAEKKEVSKVYMLATYLIPMSK